MTDEKVKKTEDKIKTGLVSISGEVGYGMKLPDQEQIVEMQIDVGTAKVLAYLVQSVEKINKNVG